MLSVYRTYDGWKSKGRQVRRGEKSTVRDENGVALFSKEQTDKRKSRLFNAFAWESPYREYEWEDEYYQDIYSEFW